MDHHAPTLRAALRHSPQMPAPCRPKRFASTCAKWSSIERNISWRTRRSVSTIRPSAIAPAVRAATMHSSYSLTHSLTRLGRYRGDFFIWQVLCHKACGAPQHRETAASLRFNAEGHGAPLAQFGADELRRCASASRASGRAKQKGADEAGAFTGHSKKSFSSAAKSVPMQPLPNSSWLLA